jgi:hypothetical protein
MRLKVCSKIWMGQGLREYVEQRVACALAKFVHRVRTVSVSLTDVNGPKGGVDKQCRVVVALTPSGTVSIAESQADIGRAIVRSMDRVGHAVGRRLERWRDAKNRGPSMGAVTADSQPLKTEQRKASA